MTRNDLAMGARFVRDLQRSLRRPITLEFAEEALRRRLARREADFLALVGRLVYANARSPYRPLLRATGAEYGDVERLVRLEGIEGALRSLFRAGVYLTVDEFKGRRPAVRGSARFQIDPADFRNPRGTVHVLAHSSGSRGPSTPVPMDLAANYEQSINRRLSFQARGALGWRHAIWGVPGGGEMVIVVRFTIVGARPERWYSQVDPAAPGLDARYRWSEWAMRLGGLLAGVPLPSPRYVPPTEPLPIARWMAEVLRAGGTPHLKTFPSSAIRVCQAAAEHGLDLTRSQFTLIGEPLTPARLATLHAFGTQAAPDFGITECGAIGEWCLAPAASDDVHLFHDLQAVIQPGRQPHPSGLPPKTMLLSSLRPRASLVLLNVSTGDQVELVSRSCGCPMERYGWATHLHTIRSFEKLSAGGMTFLDYDVVRVLEEALPTRFGGTPADYQLVEQELADGQPGLSLLVSPALGPLDAAAVREAFLDGLAGDKGGAERVMALQWRQAGLPRVERRPPHPTTSGKILHLHRL